MSIAASITLVYLFYKPFPEWWYLRFLLPVLLMMTALAVAAIVFATRRTLVLWPVMAVVVAFAMTTNAMGEALGLQRLEGRFRTVGAVARDRLPANRLHRGVEQRQRAVSRGP